MASGVVQVYAIDGPQGPDPKQVVVVVLGGELRAVDEPHGCLETLVERARALQPRRGVRQRLDQTRSPFGQLRDCRRQWTELVALGQGLETYGIGGRVVLAALAQIFEPLLPQLLDVREMPDVLDDRPGILVTTMGGHLVDSGEERPQASGHAAQPLDEVGEHPRRVNELELPVRPSRALEIRIRQAHGAFSSDPRMIPVPRQGWQPPGRSTTL